MEEKNELETEDFPESSVDKFSTSPKLEVLYQANVGSNVYFISNGPKSALIDTSLKMSSNGILSSLKEKSIPYENIALIVLTHSHFDHVGGLASIKKELNNAKVLCHKSEAKFIRDGKCDLPNATNVFRGGIVWLGRNIFTFIKKFDPCEVDIEMEGEVYSDEQYGFKDEEYYIIHTPGHTEGSISVVVGDSAIVGDLLYNRGLFHIHPPFADDLDMVHKSWKQLIERGVKNFYPAHGTKVKSEDVSKILDSKK